MNSGQTCLGQMNPRIADFHATLLTRKVLQLKVYSAATDKTWLHCNSLFVSSGASKFVDAGVLDGVSGVFGIHAWPSLPSGVISSRVRPYSL